MGECRHVCVCVYVCVCVCVCMHTHVYGACMCVYDAKYACVYYKMLIQQSVFNVIPCMLDTGEWSLVETGGSNVQGGFGHASAYDNMMRRVYVFGGYHSYSDSTSSSTSTYNLTDALYIYNVDSKEWWVLDFCNYMLPSAVYVSVF